MERNDEVIVGMWRAPEKVVEPVEKREFAPVNPIAVVVELYPVLTVNGKARPLMVTAPVAPETVMLVPATIEVTPALVSAPETRERPVPKRLLNELPFMMRLVVDAVANDA